MKNVCHVDDNLIELQIVHLMDNSGVQRWYLSENDGFLILCELNQAEDFHRQWQEQVRYIERAFNNRVNHIPILVVGINNDNSDVTNAQKNIKEFAESIGLIPLLINQYNNNEILFVFQTLSRELFDQLQKKSPEQQLENHGYCNAQSTQNSVYGKFFAHNKNKGGVPAIRRNELLSSNFSIM